MDKFEKYYTYLMSFIIWIIISGWSIVLYIARISGLWFDNMVGVMIILAAVSGIFLAISQTKPKVLSSVFILFLLYIIVSTISFITTSAFGTNYWTMKVSIFYVNVFLVGIFALFISQYFFDERIIGYLSFISIIITMLFSYESTLKITYASYSRVGSEGNPIALSYSVAFSFAFLAWECLVHRNLMLFLFIGLLGSLSVFILGTRQTVFAYIFQIIILYFAYFKKKRIASKKFHIISSKKTSYDARKLFLNLFIIVMLIFACFVFYNMKEISETINLMWSSSIQRWNVFVNEGYSDSGRIFFNRVALDTWVNSPFLGSFAYENQGRWAHQLVIDLLSQVGLLGTMVFTILWIIALYKAVLCIFSKKIFETTKIFIASVLISMTMISLTAATTLTSANFIFCLIYIANSSLEN
ncbi:hypothetical protein AT15_00475 [Kosmotoga arenicorallina S304]|uniref:Uncharacterized protein n=1 Tax=Kosmotoga arenicorallina S304 TaxID=1453497 RepID=A0A176K106_9BACT|nr:hypothetical protein [Kosmotoga arenicorallina]OAA30182.1 hypothetical protein AT15_00475 [Kosmotoga arenicorallina S304]